MPLYDPTVTGGTGTAVYTGTATVDFGAFPGKSDASVVVTGQTAILTTSEVIVRIRPEATADHSSDEHWVETIEVFAAEIVAGTGFTIYARNTSEINSALESHGAGGRVGRTVSAPGTAVAKNLGYSAPSVGGVGTRLYGQFNVSWMWV